MSALRASVWAPVVSLLAITLCGFEASAHGIGAGARAGGDRAVSLGRGWRKLQPWRKRHELRPWRGWLQP